MPGHPNFCVYRGGTFVCVIDAWGAYECPTRADEGLPLGEKNATTGERGVLKLDVHLKGVHATPTLGWHRYPHRDGFIEPWTRTGRLRPGLKLTGKFRGTCSLGSEETVAKSEIRCLSGLARFDPCFPPRGDWNRRGVVVACASPGATTFSRFAITKRS